MNIFNNKKAMSPVTIIFWYVGFLAVWLLFAAEKIRYWGLYTVETYALTGLEAFLLSNINVIVMLISFVFIVAITYFGGD